MKQKVWTNYFRTDTTDMSYYDEFLTRKGKEYHRKAKGQCARIEMMSPDEYFKQSAKSHFRRDKDAPPYTKETEQRVVVKEHVEKLEQWMNEGNKFPLPVVDFEGHNQEGRHRAYIAKKLKLKKIPVLVVKECK